jgi:hypothetical protein
MPDQNIDAEFGRLRAAVIEFVSEHIAAVVDEVANSNGGSDIATSLQNSWTSLQQSNFDSLENTAEELRLGCWQRLNADGWPNVGWREAYIFGLLFLSLSLVRKHLSASTPSHETLLSAMTHLDMALIMGGSSCDVMHALIAVVEPALLRIAPPAASDAGDEPSWVIPSEAPPWAPATSAEFAIRREADLTPAR